MNKTIRRITAAALAGVMATCMAVTASAETKTYKCSCGKTTTSTLDVSSTRAVATTSINDGTRGVSVSISGTYTLNGVEKNTGGGNSNTAGVTASISNSGGSWSKVISTHSRCCDIEKNTTHIWTKR